MEFEEKLNEMYQEIANHINGMIPIEWEQVYTIAYINDEGGEVSFNYTIPGRDDLHYYTAIPEDCNVSEKHLVSYLLLFINYLKDSESYL